MGHTPRLTLSVRSLGLVGEKGSSVRSELVRAVPPPISDRKAVFPQTPGGTPAHTLILVPCDLCRTSALQNGKLALPLYLWEFVTVEIEHERLEKKTHRVASQEG